jgi:hypothetical protein
MRETNTENSDAIFTGAKGLEYEYKPVNPVAKEQSDPGNR